MNRPARGLAFLSPVLTSPVSEVRVNFSLKQEHEVSHPALGVVCPGCGARVGKPCVSTVPTFGFGTVGTPIDGVHAERHAAAREVGVA